MMTRPIPASDLASATSGAAQPAVLLVMSNTEVCNRAHEAAAKVLSGFAAAGMTMTDPLGCAQVAAVCDGFDPAGAQGQLYVERFAGHVINVQCGTRGV